MKRNGRNIITSEDITVLGKNSGKTLDSVLESLQETQEKLKSNVKWIYKYGGVGGSGGGSSSTSDNWTVNFTLGGTQVPEVSGEDIKTIYFSSPGTKRLYFHINKPGGDSFVVQYRFNDDKNSGRVILNQDNGWTYETYIDLQTNSEITATIIDGNLTEKNFKVKYVVSAYSLTPFLTKNSGEKYESTIENGVERYNLFIRNVNNNGLNFVVKYNSAINTKATYYYTKFNSSIEESGEIDLQEGDYQKELINVPAIDNIGELTNNIAASYHFHFKVVIEGIVTEYNIPIDLLPNDLYLKIAPVDPNTILYNTNGIENPKTQLIGNRTFSITPYNGEEGGSNNITCSYFIQDVALENNQGDEIRDIVKSGNTFQRTFMFSTAGENKITFRATLGNTVRDFVYYFYTEAPSESIDWTSKEFLSSASYKYGISSNLNINGKELQNERVISKNANDQQEYDVIVPRSSGFVLGTQEMLINIGIQYNYINNEELPIITLPPYSQQDSNTIVIYQNKVEIAKASLDGNFFIEEEQNYDVNNEKKYHLITLARKYIRTVGVINYYELSVYIDGILQANTIQHIQQSQYNQIQLNRGNYSINLLDISYFNNGSLSETDIVRYWYAYQTQIRGEIENITKQGYLLNIFSEFELEKSNNLFNSHVKVAESTLTNLIQNISVPVMCLEYNPQYNLKDGVPMQFFEDWSDVLYRADSNDALSLIVGIRWANGSGNSNTKLETIDTSSISTLDGTQKNGRFRLDIQGSTTRSYKGKNYLLTLEFTEEDNAFIPVYTPWFNMDNKDSYLPENSFTLKADIVDSSHTNNTCMGKFINAMSEKFKGAEQLQSIYNGHIKNCLEGFPFLLFVRTVGSSDNYFLGIYNFNLGRTSNFNLGYSDLRALPNNLRSSENYDFNIYSVARTSTQEYVGAEIKSGLITAEIDGNESYYDFSQYDKSILFQLPDWPNDEQYMFSEIVSGQDTSGQLSENTKNAIQQFVRRSSRSGGYIFEKLGKGFHNDIQSNYTTAKGYVPNAKVQYERIKDANGQRFEIKEQDITFNDSDLFNYIFQHTDSGNEIAPFVDYQSIVEYYTICMAFGLLDSVAKNLNIKTWNGGNTFYLAFYDMDTCLGINNDGKSVLYYAFSDYWENSEGSVIDTINDIPVISAGNITVSRDYAPPSGGNINFYDIPSNYVFAVVKYAKSVLERFNILSESNISINSVITPQDLWAKWRAANGELQSANYFVENYYEGYMKGINELMYNYNFRAKYFREESNTAYDQEAKRFRGRSIGYIKDWLSKRFRMLDAYLNLAGNNEIVISDGANFDQIPTSQMVCEATPFNPPVYSSDVNINKSIFGENPSFSGDINFTVQAPDYTPIVVIGGSTIYRYLLEESSKMYNIRINNTGTNKLIFGGSSMWTYLNSINSVANGTVSITSDKLTILRGDQGNTNAWELNMPSLQEVYLNGQRYAGTLSFGSNKNFPNLTSIDISNSSISLDINDKNVRSINLSNIKSSEVSIFSCNFLEEVRFSNSYIGNCSIEPLNYISDDNGLTEEQKTLVLNSNHIGILNLKTDKKINLRISNDDTLTKLNITGFVNVTIDNCKLLKNITCANGNTNKLKSLVITNCPELENIEANVQNCETFTTDRYSNKLENITFVISGETQSLTTLKLPQSKVTNIIYKAPGGGILQQYESPNKTLNFQPFTRLNDFNIGGNNQIEYIVFNNDLNHPIYIRNSFQGCSLLRRIFGCISIYYVDYTFNGLTNFSIHGSTTTWKSENKVKDGIVQTPLQILTNEQSSDTHPTIIERYNSLNKESLFQSGSEVTNIYFGDQNGNTSGSFYLFAYNTNLDQFDVYYLLNSFGISQTINNTSLGEAAFYSRNSMFNYADGNQPNRYTFYKCNRITYLGASTPVFNSSYTLWYSPEISKGYDNGLFSPLTGLTGMSIFTSSVYTSRFVFRRVDSNSKYPLTSISSQGIAHIQDNIDTFSILSEYENSNPNMTDSSIGNMEGFFDQTQIQSLTTTLNMDVIDYDTLSFPTTIQSIQGCFRNSYGKGEFKWKETLFNRGIYSGLTTVANSFTLGNGVNGVRVPFEISDDMFSVTPNLVHLGYSDYSGWESATGRINNDSSTSVISFSYGLHGGGFLKTLKNNVFPYGITSNLSRIQNLVGLFSELYDGAPNIPDITIDFPGNLFITRGSGNSIIKITPNLRNISALFADCRIKINLTSKGFEGLSLSSVCRLFYNSVSASDDSGVKRSLDGVSIPYNFFYLGTTNVTSKDYYGTNDVSIKEADEEFMEDNETGTEFTLTDDHKITVPQKIYTRNIQYATECFFGQDKLLPYEWDKTGFNISEFPNNNYIPFTYYKEDGIWKTRENSSVYTKQYDISSIYDGISTKLEGSAYCRDIEVVENPNLNNVNLSRGFSGNYFCPPDLFYSFTNSSSLNINGMFRWCGSGSADPYGPRWRGANFNAQGRICPYLFDSIDQVTYLYEFFENFKGINSYMVGSTTYLIPPTLFEKANKITGLAKTFSGMFFDSSPDYLFLSYLIKPLDVRGIFSMCLYASNYSIQGVFNSNQLDKVSGAFSARVVSLLNNNSQGGVSVSTVLNNIRQESSSCTFGDNIDSCRNAANLAKNNIYFVYWYTPINQITSDTEKTFVGTGRYNYGTVGNES